ncbi:MAG: hypothetical protein HYY93_04450 [Planctomycetes bacterium]|nr:hypothetical protein [Planctomycetota bacterium]
MPILVDCTQRGAHSDLAQKYGVSGYPEIVFVGSSGERTDTMSSREPAALAQQILKAAGAGGTGGSAEPAAAPTGTPAQGGGSANGVDSGLVKTILMFIVAGIVSVIILAFFLKLVGRKPDA